MAQSIITLLTFKDVDSGNLPLAHSVLEWAVTHMWDDRGFFYYRVLRSHTNRISYMRWSQAWMLLAMVMLQEASSSKGAGRARWPISRGCEMIECIFTLDYEIYGNGQGSLRDLVLDPTQRLAEVFQEFDAPFVVFAEAVEFAKMEEVQC